jgi:hypothetical protein
LDTVEMHMVSARAKGAQTTLTEEGVAIHVRSSWGGADLLITVLTPRLPGEEIGPAKLTTLARQAVGFAKSSRRRLKLLGCIACMPGRNIS